MGRVSSAACRLGTVGALMSALMSTAACSAPGSPLVGTWRGTCEVTQVDPAIASAGATAFDTTYELGADGTIRINYAGRFPGGSLTYAGTFRLDNPPDDAQGVLIPDIVEKDQVRDNRGKLRYQVVGDRITITEHSRQVAGYVCTLDRS